MNWVVFHLLHQFIHRCNLHCVHIHARTVVQFRFLLGKSLQNILPCFEMIFSSCVQTFLLKIQKAKDAVENASFFREQEPKKSQSTASLTAKFYHGNIVLFYDPALMGSLGFKWSETTYIRQLYWPQQFEIYMFGKCCICSD